jgi:hypothetical protein
MLQMIRERIESLGPYRSLFLLAIPAGLVEPLKLVALAVAGDGHWIAGSCMILAAYATSLLVLERLFLVVKPKIMTLGWFARTWHWLVSLRLVKWIIAKKQAIRHGITDID